MKIKCTNCGYEGEPKISTPGSCLMELILWLFFLVPGVIYSFWRLGNKKPVCPKCGWEYPIKTEDPKEQEKWKKRAMIYTLVLVGFIIVIVSCGDASTNRNFNSSPVATNNYATITADYEIIAEEDVSYALANRYTVRVVIDKKEITKSQIKAIAGKIIKDYERNGSNATSVFFYANKEESSGAYTVAMAEWAPNGNWADAYKKDNYETTYDFLLD